ncbi:hypothetical protein PV05_06354 [Exophiala xenobiotica]|uniref:Uncharacterized protein n=1 Tax=Exophiala xenobiotica TaxID=348802 RepID=A0A0D2F1Z3_9EURO|nr:uncharacterized protein PV05_06354 [Exophiala xenobiotica]KIW53949.1 hypothetical protein PV05_06354 [Exophiala xenobiotica]
MKFFLTALLVAPTVIYLTTTSSAAPAHGSTEVNNIAFHAAFTAEVQNDSMTSMSPTKWAWVVLCLTDDLQVVPPTLKRDQGTGPAAEDNARVDKPLQPRNETQEDSMNYYNLYTSNCRSICSCEDNGDLSCTSYGNCTAGDVNVNCVDRGHCQCAFREVMSGNTARLLNGAAINGGSQYAGTNWKRGVDNQLDTE